MLSSKDCLVRSKNSEPLYIRCTAVFSSLRYNPPFIKTLIICSLVSGQHRAIDPNEVAKGLGPYAQCAQDTFEFSVRAANIVHACENIARLVSEIKQLLILGDFCWLAQTTSMNQEKLLLRKLDLDRVSIRLRDKLIAELHHLEQETSPDYPISSFSLKDT
ncbi:unnamed protein product [Heterobilharzia americana]|nr:unnamed protein product [Heterobilharzia americana]